MITTIIISVGRSPSQPWHSIFGPGNRLRNHWKGRGEAPPRKAGIIHPRRELEER
jgi:hypothetical protein